MADEQHYLFMIHPVRGQAFYDDMQPEEIAAMSAHFEYLKQALADGRLLLAGPMLDQTFGVGLLRVESEDEAWAFLRNDPSVKANMQRPELHPMKLSLWRGNNRNMNRQDRQEERAPSFLKSVNNLADGIYAVPTKDILKDDKQISLIK